MRSNKHMIATNTLDKYTIPDRKEKSTISIKIPCCRYLLPFILDIIERRNDDFNPFYLLDLYNRTCCYMPSQAQPFDAYSLYLAGL